MLLVTLGETKVTNQLLKVELEARLPNPVDDESQWKIKTDLSEIEKLDDKALDQLIPPAP